MAMDLDFDLSMHPMRDNLPDIETDPRSEDETDVVQWKSSQTSNRALDSLMREARNATRPAQRESEWGWGSPGASTSRSASVAAPPAVPPRRRARHGPRTKSLNFDPGIGLGSGAPGVDFISLVKGVSKQADENAGIRASGTGTRKGVKQSTMAKRPTSVLGLSARPRDKNKGNGKGKERMMERAASFGSSSSTSLSLSSPDSNYSFGDFGLGSGDTSMTSPEPDDCMHATQELMPPPPVPVNRLPALETRIMHPFPVHVPSALSKPRVHPHPPNPPPAPQQQQQASSTRPPTSIKPVSAPEPRLHPLLQQKPTRAPVTTNPPAVARPIPHIRAAPPAKNPRPMPTTPAPAPAPPAPAMSQSQPQQRRAPPALGMRRVNTAPLAVASSSRVLSSSQATRQFRSPFRAPTADNEGTVAATDHSMGHKAGVASTGTVKREASSSGPASGSGPAVRPRTPVREADTVPAPSSSPEVDVSDISFDLEAMEIVLQGYDDPAMLATLRAARSRVPKDEEREGGT